MDDDAPLAWSNDVQFWALAESELAPADEEATNVVPRPQQNRRK
jgi:hypothetical protein